MKTPFFIRTVILLFFMFTVLSCRKDENINNTSQQESIIYVGALLPLTGSNGTSLGLAAKAALEIARDEINDYLNMVNANFSIELDLRDTQMDTLTAVQKFNSLTMYDTRVIIGPQSNEELNVLKAFADAANVMLIGYNASSTSFTIENDNIFRFCPDDRLEGLATAVLMRADTTKVLVTVYRSDIGNTSVNKYVRGSFSTAGGTLSSQFSYGVATTNFSTVVQSIRSQVDALLTQFDTSSIAVYLASQKECSAILTAASSDSVLMKLHWYGGNGIERSGQLVSDSTAGRFASSINFTITSFGSDPAASQRSTSVAAQITSKSGQPGTANTLAVYDALWAVALAYSVTNGSDDISILKKSIMENAGRTYGATGWNILNSAGDRALAWYEYSTVRKNASGYYWSRTGSYNTATGTLTRYN
jgi:branched-chain amino acid transport system substrate-binding protein